MPLEFVLLLRPSLTVILHYCNMEIPQTWVQSVYQCMGLSRILGTTGCHYIPHGMYEEC